MKKVFKVFVLSSFIMAMLASCDKDNDLDLYEETLENRKADDPNDPPVEEQDPDLDPNT